MNYLKWCSRGLAIVYILFLSMFALDSESIVGLLIHLIPTYILVLILVIAWKRPMIGSIIFIILGVIFTIFFKTYHDPIVFFMISFPLLVIGVLFYLDYRKKTDQKKKSRKKQI